MKLLRNEKGITLVELLAVFVISGIVILLMIGVHMYSQKQFKSQTEDALHLTDVTIGAKEITKAIRSTSVVDANGTKIEFADGNTYELQNDRIYKNGSPYMYEIAQFVVIKNEDEIYLKIKSETGQEIETTLFIR